MHKYLYIIRTELMSEHYFEELGSPYMAHFCRRLADLIIEQGSEILAEKGLTTPATALSTIFYLDQNPNTTGSALASALGVSHQMATQRINALVKLDLVTRSSSDEDKRAKMVVLTRKGKKEAKRLYPFSKAIAQVFEDFEAELGCELTGIIREAERSLRQKSLKQRLKDSSRN